MRFLTATFAVAAILSSNTLAGCGGSEKKGDNKEDVTKKDDELKPIQPLKPSGTRNSPRISASSPASIGPIEKLATEIMESTEELNEALTCEEVPMKDRRVDFSSKISSLDGYKSKIQNWSRILTLLNRGIGKVVVYETVTGADGKKRTVNERAVPIQKDDVAPVLANVAEVAEAITALRNLFEKVEYSTETYGEQLRQPKHQANWEAQCVLIKGDVKGLMKHLRLNMANIVRVEASEASDKQEKVEMAEIEKVFQRELKEAGDDSKKQLEAKKKRASAAQAVRESQKQLKSVVTFTPPTVDKKVRKAYKDADGKAVGQEEMPSNGLSFLAQIKERRKD